MNIPTPSQLWPLLLCPNLSEHEVVALIGQISKNLTVNRQHLSGDDHYALSEQLVSAYTLFYLPTNMPKLAFVLNQIPLWQKKEILKSTLIDLGTGPATFILAFDQLKKEEIISEGELIGIDQSASMLKQALQLTKNFNIPAQFFEAQKFEQATIHDSTLLFGHGLNEMGVEKALAWIKKIDPKHILFLEPGTPLVFEQMQKMREKLQQLQYDCLYPCPRGDRACPISKREGDWCHQILRISHSSEIQRLGQLARLDRNQMPLIAHLYSKSLKKEGDDPRLVRYLGQSKFGWSFESCKEQDDKNVLEKIALMKKDFKGQSKKFINQLSVGDSFSYEVQGALNDGTLKVRPRS